MFGPGNIAQAHSNEEYVEIRQLEQSAEIYYKMALALCGQRKRRDPMRLNESVSLVASGAMALSMTP